MKHLKLLLILSVALLGSCTRCTNDVKIDETNFPDEVFRNWISEQEYGKDGVLTAEEITRIDTIDVSDKNIKSLDGIRFFTALRELDCYFNELTALDFSKNPALKELYCYQNQIQGEAMDAMVASLPTASNGDLRVIFSDYDGNVMTVEQVAAAKAKGWTPSYFTGAFDESGESIWEEYTGDDPTESDLP